MGHAEYHPVKAADHRLLTVHAERAAKTIRTTIVSSLFWSGALALVTNDKMPVFGAVPYQRSIALVVMVICSVLGAQLTLLRYQTVRSTDLDPDAARAWLKRLFGLTIFLSAIWGYAIWLLWDPGDKINHVFLTLVSLAIVSRFAVHRANHQAFFFGSFVPLTVPLMARLVFEFDMVELLLAGLVPLFALQVVMDCKNISERWDSEAETRFSFEDMSHALETARDEALMKRAEAEAANASKTTFLANMSHELRTPLNAILGFSDIISHEYLGPVGSPRYREYAADIHSSGTHLLSLINDLLDVAKIEAGRMTIMPETLETRLVFDDALKLVGAKARERGQILTITIEDTAAELCADERALKQIVINLVSNAVKFTQVGGRIDVHAKRDRNNAFVLTVTDNGPGIPKAKLGRVFMPFSRVDNRYSSEGGGTGLGLALVKGLAELHGGRAWIESEEGKGTRSIVLLPANLPQQVERISA
jgi:two-component system cell cycle sensor histidine kinase PleC